MKYKGNIFQTSCTREKGAEGSVSPKNRLKYLTENDDIQQNLKGLVPLVNFHKAPNEIYDLEHESNVNYHPFAS